MAEPRKVYSVADGDELGLSAKVIQSRDSGNVVVAIAGAQVLCSLADLEAAHKAGGTYRYFVPDGHGGEIETDEDGVPLG